MEFLGSSSDTCEFCEELSDSCQSRFRKIYGETLLNRTVFQSNSMVAWPTIGQLFPNSILVLPRRHIERFADLTSNEIDEFSAIVEQVRHGCDDPPNYVMFEHGAIEFGGAGCGVYHCHVHFIPVPNSLPASLLLPLPYHYHESMRDAWLFHKARGNYIVVCDTSGVVASIGHEEMLAHNIGSQYMRRRLTEIFDVAAPWDWRQYRSPEPHLMSAYKKLRFADVP